MQDSSARMDTLVETLAAFYGRHLRSWMDVPPLFDIWRNPPPLHGPWLPDRRVPIRRIAGRRRREGWDRDYDY